jgi:hypothetical protein
MAKTKSRKYTKKSKRGLLKNITRTTAKAIPMVTSGLKTVGSEVVKVTKKATPVVEKGVGTIYGALTSGFNLGVKGIKKGVSFVTKSKKSTGQSRGKRTRKNKSRRH